MKQNKKPEHSPGFLQEFGRPPGLPPETAFALPRLDLPDGCPPCWKVLERYSWTAGVALDSHGARVGVRVTDSALMERLLASFPPGWTVASSPVVDSLLSLAVVESRSRTYREPHFFLYQGACRMAHTRAFEDILPVLESLLHLQVAAHAREYLFVHAGAVAWQGQAIVIPGRSFSGKTSLVAALVRAGAEYLSDEYAVFDAQGRVHSYPKPLSFRDDAGRPLEKRTIESLGGQAAAGPLPVGLILDTKYVPGAHWRPRPVSLGSALFTLLDNTVQIRRQPQQALGILQKAVSGTAGVKSRRGEADAAAAWTLHRLNAGYS